jgi:hypothetical protein
MRKAPVFLCFLIFSAAMLSAQTEKSSWQRSGGPVRHDLALFRSMHAFNLPTTETLEKQDLEFEVSHRFFPPVHEGYNLYGLDGPINMRLGLSYAVTNKLLITAAISNANDNNDYRLKYKAVQLRGDLLPVAISLQCGMGWNTDVTGRKKGDSRNFQYYGQVIVNTLIKKKLGLGLVPSIVLNSDIIDSSTSEHSLTMGSYIEYYFSPLLAVLAEWSPVVDGYHRAHNAAAFGIELNTGGHFFKILLTNSTWINPSQYLAGTNYEFKADEWRLGFNITRLFRFKH